jgi:hypothetical protein
MLGPIECKGGAAGGGGALELFSLTEHARRFTLPVSATPIESNGPPTSQYQQLTYPISLPANFSI